MAALRRTAGGRSDIASKLAERLEREVDDRPRREFEAQRALAATKHGNHLRPAVDYLVAAAGELAGNDVTLWFLHKELRIICDHTGQPHEAETRTGPER